VKSGGWLHKWLVAQLVAEGCIERQFARAVRAIGVKTTLQPDAYRVDHQARLVHAYEVVVCESLTKERRERYRNLRSGLEVIDWRLEVTRVRVGRPRVSQRLD
jgi:hypothetical protein